MTGPEHYLEAERLIAEAHKHLGHGQGQETAGVCAAVAQVHATLAAAAATAVKTPADQEAWISVAGTSPPPHGPEPPGDGGAGGQTRPTEPARPKGQRGVELPKQAP